MKFSLKKYSIFWPELILLIVFCFLLFFDLGQKDIGRWDEFTNISVVKETAGNQLNLLLVYQNEPFFEKPPLWYWLNISLLEIFEESNTLFRLISAVSGLLLGINVYLYSLKFVSRKAAIISLIAMLSTWHLFFQNDRFFSTHNLRSADLDALQLLFIFSTFFSLSLAFLQTETKHKKFYTILSAILTSLAFMTKGPFALLPILVFFIYFLINRNFKQAQYLLFAIIIASALIIPWHVFMYINYGNEFLNEYFGYHILSRASTQLEGHNNNLLFYFRIMTNFSFFGVFPLFIVSFINGIFNKDKICQLLMTAITTTMIILLIISTKLSWYLFYFYPFAFILIGIIFANPMKNLSSMYSKLKKLEIIHF